MTEVLKAQISEAQIREAMEHVPGFAASHEWDFKQDGESLATFWRQATPGTTYWRCYVPAKALPGDVVNFGEDPVEYDPETGVLTLHAQGAGAAIWQFLGDDGRARAALKSRDQGTPTLMELDDNYLTRPPTSHATAVWAKTHQEALARAQVGRGNAYSVEMHKIILPQFDGLIVSTPYLADLYEAHNPKVFVCENSIDPSDWDVRREAREIPRFGYYGSTGHGRDWATAKKAVKQALRGREFMFIGFTPPGWSGLTAPWQEGLMRARQNLGLIDIGLCPLEPGRFSDGKSDVKAMEYAMAGVLPIVSRTEPYRWWFEEQGWPWVATPETWGKVLKEAAALSAEEVAAEAAKAKALVLEHRTIQDNIWKWREAIARVS